ncbi:Wadjet anti-phage system protein JetD domain-containing protein [Georgenia yuyongxinii]|uniref:DUF3322 and DUF2220 domain-containing protein n=1 Tax=Georgenia yuyongxinii TaxID=2589797 RepID=A0A552WTS4_9MICO|nr:Wadjet anti-phage system protein JetD domain-containing protein [Georgenia yuyongxinii]TRW45733.1 hypothetical protein FJ693_08130 [Georgenia yuyongxinii]
MTASMLTSAAARATAQKVYDKHYAQWAVSPPGQGASLVDLPLRPPTESVALRDPSAVADWISSWNQVPPTSTDALVIWESRRWASMGTQRVPTRLRLATPEAVATFGRRSGHWQTARLRAEALLAVLPPSERVAGAVRRTMRVVVGLDADDVDRLVAVLGWLQEHPDSGLFVRQLPIRGIDTKWTERHRQTVTALFTAATGAEDLGLAARPGLVRVRFLDPALAPGGIEDLSAPVADLAQLRIAPRHVLVVENLETLLSLPALPDVVAIHGQGYAVGVLDQIPWIPEADLVYWGDLDTDGLNILSIARLKAPQTRSVLMNRATLETSLDLAVPDPKPRRTFAGPLTPSELDAVAALRAAGDVRLEQERIPWQAALGAVRLALGRPQP